MKKFFYCLLVSMLLLLPIGVFGKEKVYISNVKVEDKSFFAEEMEEVSYNDLNLSFQVSFSKLEDYIRYRITVQNDSSKDYEIGDLNESLQKSEYVQYDLKFEDGTNVIKAHSSKDLYVFASYVKEVDDSSLTSEGYKESNEMSISLATDSIQNPNTGFKVIFLVLVLVVAVVGVVISINNEKFVKNMYVAIVLGIIVLPVVAYALEMLSINIHSSVTIQPGLSFCYEDTYYAFENGTIMSDYLSTHEDFEPNYFRYHEGQLDKNDLNQKFANLTNGEYTDLSVLEDEDVYNQIRSSLSDFQLDMFDNLYTRYNFGTIRIFNYLPIIDASVGCYYRPPTK